MPRTIPLLLIVLFLFGLSACAAHRHMEAGDAAAATGDMRGALYHYQRAVHADEDLTRDETFMARMATAESRVAYDDAVRLRASGDYEKAIAQLHKAIERDPSYDPPKQLLPHVRVEAARVRYVRAVQAADAGDLRKAREHLDRALQHDLSNEQAAFAMTALSPERLPDSTPGLGTLREGQSHSAERRWIDAEAALVRAVAEGPGLLTARAALHEARHNLLRSRRLTDQGEARLTERQISPSMQALTQALEIWPGNARAGEALVQARTQRALADAKLASSAEAAAEQAWERAIALADSGLKIDRSHDGLLSALRQYRERGAADYAELGDAMLAERKLIEAQKAYARAVELAPSLRSALSGLRDTETRLSRAYGLTAKGEAHIDLVQMSGAISLLKDSLAIWPFNDKAQRLLQHAQQQQQRAGQTYQASSEAAAQQAWDKAITLADQALKIDQSYAGLSELRSQLPQRAAGAYTQEGDVHLQKNQLDQAQAAYAQALRFVGEHGAALSGTASVYLARGEALEAKGLHGAALLHYAAGLAYRDKHPVADAYSQALSAVRARVGMGLGLTVEGGKGGAVGPDQVADTVAGVLAGYSDSGLIVGQAGSPYTLQLTIGRATIDQQRVRSVNHTHAFTTRELHHNDAYDRIAAHLHREQRVWNDIKSDYDHHVRRHRAAQHDAQRMHPGQPPSKPPSSSPQRRAKPNGGDGAEEDERARRRERARRERQQAEYDRQMAEYKRKQQAYQRELAHVERFKSQCDRLHRSLRDQERIVKKLRHELSCTPRQIKVTVKHTWPYTVETYTKRGRLAVTAELIDAATGKAVDRIDHHADFAKSDDLLLNANPKVGLRDDPLELPSDRSVRGVLSREVAEAAGPWAVQAAVQHQLGLINKRVETLRQNGKAQAVLEAQVDAAVLLGV